MDTNKILKLASNFERLANTLDKPYTREPSQGDGWKITTDYGFIEYRPVEDGHGDPLNEIWYIESKTPGGGTKLVDFMMRENPADSIAWGATSLQGEAFMKRWHAKHPNVQCVTGDFDGQFNPYDPRDEEDDEVEEESTGENAPWTQLNLPFGKSAAKKSKCTECTDIHCCMNYASTHEFHDSNEAKCIGFKKAPVGSPKQRAFCKRHCAMKKKLTSKKVADDPDSCINKGLRRWKCRCR